MSLLFPKRMTGILGISDHFLGRCQAGSFIVFPKRITEIPGISNHFLGRIVSWLFT
jgi:hypothetical protein